MKYVLFWNGQELIRSSEKEVREFAKTIVLDNLDELSIRKVEE